MIQNRCTVIKPRYAFSPGDVDSLPAIYTLLLLESGKVFCQWESNCCSLQNLVLPSTILSRYDSFYWMLFVVLPQTCLSRVRGILQARYRCKMHENSRKDLVPDRTMVT